MRIPLLQKTRPRLQVSKVVGFPAPIGGLNARDPLAGMGKTDAVYMLNLYPRGNYVEIRSGNAAHATGMTGNGKTLVVHSAMNGTETMFCSTPSGVYNVSSAGAVGAAVIARTDGKHQWTNYGDGTNNWLIMVNGVDKPAYYNGTAWTAVDGGSVPALTGLTTTSIIGTFVYQGRLFFIEKDTLKIWYLASGVVGGALTAFDLSTQAARGGYLVAAMNWTFDGGSGSDDHLALVTSMGEVIVYRGTDPGVAADWSKVGTYYIGKPLGRQCMCKYGGDLIVLTEDGIIGLSGALSGVVNESKYKLSDKIRNKYLLYAQVYAGSYGWQAVIYPKENALLVNVPVAEDSASTKLVMNLQTGAWTEFSSWDVTSHVVYNKALYGCLTTKVNKYWTGTADAANGTTTILAQMSSAYSNLGTPNFKNVKSIRFQTEGNTSQAIINVGVSTSFNIIGNADSSSTLTIPANMANKYWSAAPSNGGTWVAAFMLNLDATSGGLLRFNSIEYLYEEGSVSA